MSLDELRVVVEQQKQDFQLLREQYEAQLQAVQPQVGAEAQAPEVGSVAVRLPTFWIASPELWFAQVEANFDNRNPKITTDMSKYNHVLQALSEEVLNECEHAISSQGPDRYPALKRALLKAYGKSTAKKSAELLEMAAKPGSMSGRRPSTIMMRIRSLSGSSYDALERAMFLNQLPVPVRTALASSNIASNDDLTAEADRITEEFELATAAQGSPAVHVTTLPMAPPLEVDATFARRPFRPSTSSPVVGHRPQQDALCFLHRKYGVYAHSCKSQICPMRNQISKAPGNARAGR